MYLCALENGPMMGSQIEVCCSSLPSFAIAKAFSLWRTREWPFHNNLFSLLWRVLAFTTASSILHRGEPKAAIFLDLSFVVAKHSFAVANISAAANQYVSTNQQLHLKLTSSIILLDFPSKPAKHKQMGD